jgi:hypothetical protein
MAFKLICFLFLLISPIHAETNPLQNKKEALQLELNLVQQAPATYYLIIDFTAKEVHLKADANLLRTCTILGSFGIKHTQTEELILNKLITPQTSEPSVISRRRPLPLDFSGRLTTGPKHRSRLYFAPTFLVQSADLPTSNHIPGIRLSNPDIKALASALVPSSKAILIPQMVPYGETH